MNRKQRVRVCGNILKLMEKVESEQLREHYRQQYVRTASRINEKQPTGVGAGELRNLGKSINYKLPLFGGKSNAI